jgi:hypothetical protein
MDQTEKSSAWKSTSPHQRRAQSVDEYSLQKLNEEYYGNGSEHINGTINNGDHHMTAHVEDTYVCAALTRTNNRPIAKTCW